MEIFVVCHREFSCESTGETILKINPYLSKLRGFLLAHLSDTHHSDTQYADNRPTIITLVGMVAVGMVCVGMVPAPRYGYG